MKIILVLISFTISSTIYMSLNNKIVNLHKLKKMKSKKFWTIKANFPPKQDILIFGNSRIYRGINPKMDPKKRLSFNLGFSSAGLSPYFIKKNFDRNNNPNTIILLGVSPGSFISEGFRNEHWNEFRSKSFDENFFNKSVKLQKIFSRFSVINLRKGSTPKYQETFDYNTGFVGSDHKIYNPEKAIKSYRASYRKGLHLFNKKLFLETVSFLKNAGYKKIFAFRVPSSFEMEQLEDTEGAYDEDFVIKSLKSIGVTWIEIPIKKDLISYDGSHLNHESANKLSHYIFSQI